MNIQETIHHQDHQKVIEEGNGKYVDHSEPEPNKNGGQSNISYHLTEDQFEKLVLSKSTLANTIGGGGVPVFGDPNPLAYSSFVIPLTPTAACLMYWGATTPASLIGIAGQLFLTGGIGLWFAALMSWAQGATFAMVTFAMYGSFWFGLGFVNLPSQGLVAALGGPTSPTFTDEFGAYMMSFAIFNLIMTFFSFRVNLAFVTIFFTVFTGTTLLAAGYWRAKHDAQEAERLFKAAGAILWVTVVDGWYLFADAMIPSVGLTKRLPLGAFSGGFGRFKKE